MYKSLWLASQLNSNKIQAEEKTLTKAEASKSTVPSENWKCLRSWSVMCEQCRADCRCRRWQGPDWEGLVCLEKEWRLYSENKRHYWRVWSRGISCPWLSFGRMSWLQCGEQIQFRTPREQLEGSRRNSRERCWWPEAQNGRRDGEEWHDSRTRAGKKGLDSSLFQPLELSPPWTRHNLPLLMDPYSYHLTIRGRYFSA